MPIAVIITMTTATITLLSNVTSNNNNNNHEKSLSCCCMPGPGTPSPEWHSAGALSVVRDFWLKIAHTILSLIICVDYWDNNKDDDADYDDDDAADKVILGDKRNGVRELWELMLLN